MVIGSILSGFFTGICAVVMGLSYGLPVWLLVVLYPLIGSAGSLAFVMRVISRAQRSDSFTPVNAQMVMQSR